MIHSQITLRPATLDDVEMLAAMNSELIKDEKCANPMSVTELQERMTQLISQDWEGLVFLLDGLEVGYTLLQRRDSQYAGTPKIFFIRQFFVCRRHRRRGVGRAALEQIERTICCAGSQIELGVLESNPNGRLFWESLGFVPASTTMRRLCAT